jgi:DNA-binding HxlR family transcriptional regulator
MIQRCENDIINENNLNNESDDSMTSRTPTVDVVMHPVRLRVIQHVAGREVTTAQLRKALPDVTPATLYRHVAALIDAGILRVVAERRVRGAVERTLALGQREARGGREELQAMSEEQHRRSFATFLAHLAADFDRFVTHGDAESRSFLGYGQTPLYVSADDLARIQEQIQQILDPYISGGSGEGHRVTLATVLIPEPPVED